MGSSTSPLDKDMIARRLAAVRAELGLSQAALAEQVGLSKRTYIHYERGEREVRGGERLLHVKGGAAVPLQRLVEQG